MPSKHRKRTSSASSDESEVSREQSKVSKKERKEKDVSPKSKKDKKKLKEDSQSPPQKSRRDSFQNDSQDDREKALENTDTRPKDKKKKKDKSKKPTERSQSKERNLSDEDVEVYAEIPENSKDDSKSKKKEKKRDKSEDRKESDSEEEMVENPPKEKSKGKKKRDKKLKTEDRQDDEDVKSAENCNAKPELREDGNVNQGFQKDNRGFEDSYDARWHSSNSMKGHLEADNFVFESPKKFVVAAHLAGVVALLESIATIALSIHIVGQGSIKANDDLKDYEDSVYAYILVHAITLITTCLLFHANQKGYTGILMLWIVVQVLSAVAEVGGLVFFIFTVGKNLTNAFKNNLKVFVLFSSFFFGFLVLKVFTVTIVLLRYRKLVWKPSLTFDFTSGMIPLEDRQWTEGSFEEVHLRERSNPSTLQSSRRSSSPKIQTCNDMKDSASTEPLPIRETETVSIATEEKVFKKELEEISIKDLGGNSVREADRVSLEESVLELDRKSQTGSRFQGTIPRPRFVPEGEYTDNSRWNTLQSVVSISIPTHQGPVVIVTNDTGRPVPAPRISLQTYEPSRRSMPFGAVPAIGSPEEYERRMRQRENSPRHFYEPEPDYSR